MYRELAGVHRSGAYREILVDFADVSERGQSRRRRGVLQGGWPRTTRHRRSPQLSRGRPPRVAGCDDASLLALGSLLASPSNLSAVAGEGRSPMTVAGPRRISTGFLHHHPPTTGSLPHAGQAP